MRPSWRGVAAGIVSAAVLFALWWSPDFRAGARLGLESQVAPAEAQGVGILARASCSTINSPISGQTWCFEQSTRVLKVWDGANWATVTISNNGATGFAGLFAVATCTQINSPIVGQSFCLEQAGNKLKVWNGSVWVQPPTDVINVRDYGAVDDGVTDNCATTSGVNFFQRAVDTATATSANGGIVYIPSAATRWLCTGGVKVNVSGATASPLAIVGDGKWATVIRYTGSASFITTVGASTPSQIRLENFSVQLTNAGAIAIDASQFINSTFRSLRAAWSGAGAAGGVGLSSNPTNASNTPFYNVVDDLTTDSVASGIVLNSQVANAPNRWRIIAPTVLSPQAANSISGIVIGNSSNNSVSGVDIVAPYFDQIGGAGIVLGGNADRVTIVAARMETAQGGTLFRFSPAANRTNILGYAVHAGSIGTTCTGTRGAVFGAWDDIHICNQTNGSADLFSVNAGGANGGVNLNAGFDPGVGSINIASAAYFNGIPALVASAASPNLMNIRGITASNTLSNNLRGTCNFAASTTCVKQFGDNEPDAHYFVALSCSGTNPIGLSAKTRAGFTLTATVSNSNTCDYILIR